MSKAKRIKELLEQGMSIREIAKRMKVSRSYIYMIRAQNKRKPFAPVFTAPTELTRWQKICNWFKNL